MVWHPLRDSVKHYIYKEASFKDFFNDLFSFFLSNTEDCRCTALTDSFSEEKVENMTDFLNEIELVVQWRVEFWRTLKMLNLFH